MYLQCLLQEVVAIGELRLAHFSEIDLAEVKHEINVLKYSSKKKSAI